MTADQLIQALREEIERELSAKTGWGRVEAMAAIERALTAAVLRFIDFKG